MLQCGGLSSRDAVPQGVGDSASEIFRRDVGFPRGYFVSRIWRDVVLAAISTGKLLQINYWETNFLYFPVDLKEQGLKQIQKCVLDRGALLV